MASQEEVTIFLFSLILEIGPSDIHNNIFIFIKDIKKNKDESSIVWNLVSFRFRETKVVFQIFYFRESQTK